MSEAGQPAVRDVLAATFKFCRVITQIVKPAPLRFRIITACLTTHLSTDTAFQLGSSSNLGIHCTKQWTMVH